MQACTYVAHPLVCAVSSATAKFRVSRPPPAVHFLAGSWSLAVCSLNNTDLAVNLTRLLSLDSRVGSYVREEGVLGRARARSGRRVGWNFCDLCLI